MAHAVRTLAVLRFEEALPSAVVVVQRELRAQCVANVAWAFGRQQVRELEAWAAVAGAARRAFGAQEEPRHATNSLRAPAKASVKGAEAIPLRGALR